MIKSQLMKYQTYIENTILVLVHIELLVDPALLVVPAGHLVGAAHPATQ